MSDKEIIKALEYCIDYENNCIKCPQHSNGNCIDDLLKQALALITHQQAEIDDIIKRQQAEIKRQKSFLNLTYKIDGEQLEKIKNKCLENIELNIEAIKAEAIKEFAERLKKSDDFYDCIRAIGNVDKIDCVVNLIDNLVKEMVGDT